MRFCQDCHRCYGEGVEFCLFDRQPTRIVKTLPLVIDGKYRLERLIAHGGMGSVYRATHLALDRAVAIKILRAEYLADPTIRERFNREARAAARLKHPNIVAVYDYGLLPSTRDDGCGAYFVMELVEGHNLRQEMRALASGDAGISPHRAAAILRQVCAGIDAAHRQGIIHRDLKPDNIMIESDDDGAERILVLDFGIAKLRDQDYALQGLTDENTVIGTPNYISPEQCTGSAVDARSDIYSLGVILYEMLTGRAPFVGLNTSTVLLKHMQEPPLPPTRIREGLDPRVEQVILRALAKNPRDRFPSAVGMAQALISAVNGISASYDASYDHVDEEITLAKVKQAKAVGSDIVTAELTVINGFSRVEPDAGSARSGERYLINNVDDRDATPPLTLLIDRRPRPVLYATILILSSAIIAILGYYWSSGWEAQADGATAAVTTSAVSEKERSEQEVKRIYNDWALSAVRGDWTAHMKFYADRVDYFRDGALSRKKVEERKRKIFGGLDSYSLRFSQEPQIRLKTRTGQTEAEVIFDRNWVLRRGRSRASGKARGLLTLQRDSDGWSIISERQIR